MHSFELLQFNIIVAFGAFGRIYTVETIQGECCIKDLSEMLSLQCTG